MVDPTTGELGMTLDAWLAFRTALERVVRGGERCLKLGSDAECRLALEASVEIARAALGKSDVQEK